MRRHAQAKLHLLKGFLVAGNDARRDRGRRLMVAIGHRTERQKASFNQVNKVAVIQVSSGGNDDVVGGEALPVKIKQLFLLERADGFLGTQNRLAQRMVFPEILRKD